MAPIIPTAWLTAPDALNITIPRATLALSGPLATYCQDSSVNASKKKNLLTIVDSKEKLLFAQMVIIIKFK